jgi:hypothetical protein
MDTSATTYTGKQLGRPILYTVDNNNETLEIFQTEVV